MTACFKLVKAFQQQVGNDPEQHCPPCVYFSRNLDKAASSIPREAAERCGLEFLPGDANCVEMRTDNCSVRNSKS